ncbi:MAG: tRNA lysidine(34) synthetase TilS [Clostridiales bacterium]|nr:tRNA lysidine(34) synthetase TilS [Clostridiales bacterium]
MNERIFSKVKGYIEKYQMLVPGDTVVVGVSGGADSVCLLLMLYELANEIPLKLLVVHINHGIREEAKKDAAYVEKLCKERNLPFYLIEENVKEYAKREKLSEEEAGRKVRYQAFARVLEKQSGNKTADSKIADSKIAIAHNASDRVETMLFHLFRGTGLSGVSGIKPVRDNIIRPLLCLKREEIEEYLSDKQVSFCIDHTNLEDTYTRNRIRNHILPFAEREICYGAVSHMWEAADMLLDTEEYISKQARRIYEECRLQEEETYKRYSLRIVLRTDELLAQEPFMQKQVLLKCLEEITEGRKDITSVHIEEIRKLLDRQGSKQVSLPYGLTAVKEYDRLILYDANSGKNGSQAEKKAEPILISIPGTVNVPGLGELEFSVFSYEKTQIIPEKSYTKWFDYDRITKSLLFRTRETGDYLTINKDLSKKTLKNYMIEEKIPKSKRGELYVLADGSHILWVPGYRISQYYKVTEYTKSILQVQLRGGL